MTNINKIKINNNNKKEEEQKMKKMENIKMVEKIILKGKEEENKINKILQNAGIQVNKIRKMIRSLDAERMREMLHPKDDETKENLDSYIERQEKFVKIEKRIGRFLQVKINILKDALENIEKEMEKNNIKYIDLNTDTQMTISAVERRYKDVCAKHTNSYLKIKTTENIIEKEKKKMEK